VTSLWRGPVNTYNYRHGPQVADIGQSMAAPGKFELHEQIKRGFTERGQLLRLLDNYEDRDDLIAWIRERGSAERGRYLGNVTASSGLVMPRLRAVMRKWIRWLWQDVRPGRQ
jgi:hypothetical protein